VHFIKAPGKWFSRDSSGSPQARQEFSSDWSAFTNDWGKKQNRLRVWTGKNVSSKKRGKTGVCQVPRSKKKNAEFLPGQKRKDPHIEDKFDLLGKKRENAKFRPFSKNSELGRKTHVSNLLTRRGVHK